MIKKKTTEDIFNKCITLSKASVDLGIDENYELKNCRDLWKKEVWISEDSLRENLLDMYRLMCNKYGKANIWTMNADELLENVDLLINEILESVKE